MGRTDEFTSRSLLVDDAEAGLRLSTATGWNQTLDDWQTIVRGGASIGRFAADGRLVATAVVQPYARVGWIAMVLTAADARRRGLAAANMDWALAKCERLGLAPALDATPDGREVYRRLGFEDRWTTTRWLRTDSATRPPPVTAGQSGAVWWRPGRTATHIGPLVADGGARALELLGDALDAVSGPAIIDVPDRHQTFAAALAAAGFEPQRTFTRMEMAGSELVRSPTRWYAIAGPEWG
ncbi:MAG: GNAT family N-acetyltransferase [Actinomycetota bacterium]